MTSCGTIQKMLKLLDIRLTGNEVGWGEETIFKALRKGRSHPSRGFEELYTFVLWIFGDDHLPNLQVLAFGDFSYGNRYYERNILLCKQDPKEGGLNFRVMGKEEICGFEDRGLLNFDFLSACSKVNLYYT